MDWGNILGQSITQGLGVLAVIYALAAIGLNVHFGYTGLLNFGQAGFLAVAAYGLAVTIVVLELPLFVGVFVGLLAAVVLALLLGIPTLRLRADYLAIVTIAAAEIIRLLVRSVTLREIFGGSDGINAFANEFFTYSPYSAGVELGPVRFSQNDLWVVTVGWVLVVLSCVLVWLLMRSPWGRVIKAIREDEDGPHHSTGAAEDQHRVGEERQVRAVAVGLNGLETDGEDEAAQAAQHATDDQRLHLVEVDVLAK